MNDEWHDEWHMESFNVGAKKTLFIFRHIEESDLTISFRSITEIEAWEKLGKLLNKPKGLLSHR